MHLRFLGYCDSAYQESPYRPDDLTPDAIPKGAPIVKIDQDGEEIRVVFRRNDGAIARDMVYPEEVEPWSPPAPIALP